MPLSAATKDEIRIQVQEGIQSAFQDITLPPADCADRLNDVEKSVESHNEFINGNGKEGAKVEMHLLKQSIIQLEEWRKSIDAKTWAIIVLLIGNIISSYLFK